MLDLLYDQNIPFHFMLPGWLISLCSAEDYPNTAKRLAVQLG